MSKIGGIIVIVVSLLAGFGGGFLYEATLGKTTASKATTSGSSTTSESTSTKQNQAECLTDVWGEDKYAAISANSSLATTEDNLAALKCYE